MIHLTRNESTKAACEFLILAFALEKSDGVNVPDHVEVRFTHGNRKQSSSRRSLKCAEQVSDQVIKVSWDPQESISVPITLYAKDDDSFDKKTWNIEIIGIFDHSESDGSKSKEKEVVLGRTRVDFRNYLKRSEAEIETLKLNQTKDNYRCALRAKIKISLEGAADKAIDRRDGNGQNFFEMAKLDSSAVFENMCVLLVGITGSGKTSTLNIFTGNEMPTGNEEHSVTTKTVVCEDFIHPGEAAWVDNPGWSDTSGRSDAIMFKNLLKFLQSNRMYNVKAVIWCVLPQPRMDATLQAQAEFIDMLTVEQDKGRIWSNVIIIAKAGSDAESDCLGAISAARKQFVQANPKKLSYEFCSEEVLKGTVKELRINKLRMLTNEEIRKELEITLEKLENPVQVVFANQRCEDCGQTGDPRLMDDICHKEKVLGHTGKLEQRFPKLHVAATVAAGIAGAIGLGTVAAAAPGAETALIALLGIPMAMAPGSICALHRFFNTESSEESPTCIRLNDMRWSCCRKGEKATGCTFKCSCGSLWGNGPGCVLIRHPDANAARALQGYEVFIKQHKLVQNEDETTAKQSLTEALL